jgi:hypothetical protein
MTNDHVRDSLKHLLYYINYGRTKWVLKLKKNVYSVYFVILNNVTPVL